MLIVAATARNNGADEEHSDILIPGLDEIPNVPQDTFDHIHCKGVSDTVGLEDMVEARTKTARRIRGNARRSLVKACGETTMNRSRWCIAREMNPMS